MIGILKKAPSLSDEALKVNEVVSRDSSLGESLFEVESNMFPPLSSPILHINWLVCGGIEPEPVSTSWISPKG